jgi:hypothetical protein
MVSEVFAGLSSLKAAFDIAKGLKDIDNAARRNSAVIELQEKILAAREAQTVLLDRIGELEKEVAAFEAWNAENKHYQLQKIDRGAFAYVRKPDAQPAEPAHWLCTACYQNNKKSLLQYHHAHERDHIYRCSVCSAEVRVHFSTSPSEPSSEQ